MNLRAHSAADDVEMMIGIVKDPKFWKSRMDPKARRVLDSIRGIKIDEAELQRITERHADECEWEEGEEDDEESLTAEEEDDINPDDVPDWANGWTLNKTTPSVDVEEQFKTQMRSRSVIKDRNDLEGRLHGPTKTKKELNTVEKCVSALLDDGYWKLIVECTNLYGKYVDGVTWRDVTVSELKDFMAICHMAACQKRSDNPTRWFSTSIGVGLVGASNVMSGRRFLQILRGLHCCDYRQDNEESGYKIGKLKELLEKNFNANFIPGSCLSLDESLLRAYGRIKFKVRIITKSARYGIKLFVLTDSDTAYVLQIDMYTGKDEEEERKNQFKSKLVGLVMNLLGPYHNTGRSVFVDRYYTSIDLLKSIMEIGLHCTGTLMGNRIPTRARTSEKSVKDHPRGHTVRHQFTY